MLALSLNRNEIIEWANRLSCQGLIDRVYALVEQGQLKEAQDQVKKAEAILKEAAKLQVVRDVQQRLDTGHFEAAQEIIVHARDSTYPQLHNRFESTISRLSNSKQRVARQLLDRCDDTLGEERRDALEKLEKYLSSSR
jgi:hypothetical protein